MWPVLLDMTKEESMQSLRNLELEAYAHLVSALRAQGPLNADKRKLLKDTSQALNIPQDRHKAEIRRAVNDEKLNTIAYHVTGLSESLEDWAQEGRRTVPLLPRMAPQTAFSAIADEAAEGANHTNKQLPPPGATERKRPPAQPAPMPETSKQVPFRVPEAPKQEESKKRKLPIEASTLAQHLLGPSKIARTPQIYRQRTKGFLKEQAAKVKQGAKVPFSPHLQTPNGPKINIVQNVAVPPPPVSSSEETIEQIQNEINSYAKPLDGAAAVASCSNENQAPRPKLINPVRAGPSLTFKQIPGPSSIDASKTLKMCPAKKAIAKGASPMAQKLIVVSNAQTIQSSSILHKTLSIPLVKNISVKNLEKFKIVTTSSPQIVSGPNNLNSFKHKVVTVKTNPTTKKVIPLSLLNSKGGIKVLPIGGKIVGKTTTTTTSSPLYIVNTMGLTKTITTTQPITSTITVPIPNSSNENGKSAVLGDILRASGVTTDDFDTQIEEFRIPNNHVVEAELVHEQVEEEIPGIEKQDFIILEDGCSCEIETSKSVELEQFNSDVVIEDVTETVVLPMSADCAAEAAN